MSGKTWRLALNLAGTLLFSCGSSWVQAHVNRQAGVTKKPEHNMLRQGKESSGFLVSPERCKK